MNEVGIDTSEIMTSEKPDSKEGQEQLSHGRQYLSALFRLQTLCHRCILCIE